MHTTGRECVRVMLILGSLANFLSVTKRRVLWSTSPTANDHATAVQALIARTPGEACIEFHANAVAQLVAYLGSSSSSVLTPHRSEISQQDS